MLWNLLWIILLKNANALEGLVMRLIGRRATVLALGALGACGGLEAGVSTQPPADSTSVVPPANHHVARVEVTPPTLTLRIGDVASLTVVVTDSSGATVVRTPAWSSANPLIASVSAGGAVSGLSVGTGEIDANVDGVVGRAAVTVLAQPISKIVIVVPGDGELHGGDTATIQTKLTDANGNALSPRPLTWTTSRPAALSIDSTGFARVPVGAAVGFNFVTVTASGDGATATASITVKDWSKSGVTTDPVTLKRSSTLSLSSDRASPNGMDLFFRCTGGVMEAFVETSSITANGNVVYRFANSSPTSATWTEATNFQALFFPGDGRSFAGLLSTSDSLFFQYGAFQSTTRSAVFTARGLAAVLPDFLSTC